MEDKPLLTREYLASLSVDELIEGIILADTDIEVELLASEIRRRDLAGHLKAYQVHK